MNFQVTVGGKHKATVSLALGPSGTFTGTIESDDFGRGSLEGQQSGGVFDGTAALDGHTADFSAKLDGTAISGNLHAGWFFSENFTGVQTA